MYLRLAILVVGIFPNKIIKMTDSLSVAYLKGGGGGGGGGRGWRVLTNPLLQNRG